MGKGRKLPEVLTSDELKGLLKQPNQKAPTGLRNLCILAIMSYAGLRSAEIINLKPSHINLQTGEIVVRGGKGKKDRILWVQEEVIELLRKWRKVRPEGDLFFSTLKGSILSDRYLRDMVKRYAKRAGINKNISPHTLRHTFATDLLRQTKNIRLVQKALGHSDLSTTMIYTHIVDTELEEALKIFRKGPVL